MASKNSSGSNSRSLTVLLAFVSIALFAVAWILSFIFSQIGWNAGIINWIKTASTIFMSIVVLIVAYNFVRYRHGWAYHVIYWLCAAIVIVFQILFVVF